MVPIETAIQTVRSEGIQIPIPPGSGLDVDYEEALSACAHAVQALEELEHTSSQGTVQALESIADRWERVATISLGLDCPMQPGDAAIANVLCSSSTGLTGSQRAAAMLEGLERDILGVFEGVLVVVGHFFPVSRGRNTKARLPPHLQQVPVFRGRTAVEVEAFDFCCEEALDSGLDESEYTIPGPRPGQAQVRAISRSERGLLDELERKHRENIENLTRGG